MDTMNPNKFYSIRTTYRNILPYYYFSVLISEEIMWYVKSTSVVLETVQRYARIYEHCIYAWMRCNEYFIVWMKRRIIQHSKVVKCKHECCFIVKVKSTQIVSVTTENGLRLRRFELFVRLIVNLLVFFSCLSFLCSCSILPLTTGICLLCLLLCHEKFALPSCSSQRDFFLTNDLNDASKRG